MAESFPNINGYEYSFASIEINVDGRTYTGIKAMNYRHSREVGNAEGSPAELLGFARGSYTGVEGDMMMLRRTHDTLVQDLGPGYFDRMWDAIVSYAEEGLPLVTDELRGCTFTEEDYSNERGADPTMISLSFKGLQLRPNGVAPLRDMID
ncbi:MAG: hypothetical protein AAGA56_08690 [Myxococcota bacterium]